MLSSGQENKHTSFTNMKVIVQTALILQTNHFISMLLIIFANFLLLNVWKRLQPCCFSLEPSNQRLVCTCRTRWMHLTFGYRGWSHFLITGFEIAVWSATWGETASVPILSSLSGDLIKDCAWQRRLCHTCGCSLLDIMSRALWSLTG